MTYSIIITTLSSSTENTFSLRYRVGEISEVDVVELRKSKSSDDNVRRDTTATNLAISNSENYYFYFSAPI